jgi:hypothetical protein
MPEKFKRKCRRKQLILSTVLVMMRGCVIPILGNKGAGSEKEEAGRVLKLHEVQRIEDAQVEIRPEVFRFAPPVKHLNDVQQLFIRGDYIWVMTSTIEPGKGVLFDVFNEQGEYVDHFYLPLQQSVIAEALEDLPLAFQKDHIYVVEYDEDDLPTIVKYRIAAQN